VSKEKYLEWFCESGVSSGEALWQYHERTRKPQTIDERIEIISKFLSKHPEDVHAQRMLAEKLRQKGYSK